MSEMEPTIEQVEGLEEHEFPAARVVVETPVRTQELPSSNADMSYVTLPDDSVSDTPLFGNDPRRSCVTLLTIDEEIMVATNQAALRKNTGMRWPINVPLVLRHREEIWVKCMDAAGTALSWNYELWTE
jgi:hypothetical protein